jgi:hypothetical protein
MLDLAPRSSTLDAFHQRFLDDAFPPELSRAAFAAFDAGAYDAPLRARGVRAFQLRALDEYRSQVAFTELLAELTEMGFSWDVLGTAVRIVRDEARHVELCRRMIAALGGGDRVPGEPRWVRSDKRLPVRARVLRTIVGSLCIGETISVRMLAAGRDATVDPLARALATCLTADESVHGRFGWAVLELMAPGLDDAERELLWERIPRWLASTGASMVPAVAAPAAAAPVAGRAARPPSPFGSLPAGRRAEVFADALERDVLRRFAELDIAHGRAVARAAA